uniref:Uncharacterized protein n=1 Tax=Tanacetum cinerariifolium TaxID=118510 RepID=A0A6L2N6X0_TANCI|nr:hypothetical protein [Tanacetum cinerariifolium]
MGSNIPTVFSWGSSIGPEGFMPSILLLVVIIVVVVVIVIVIGDVPSIIKLFFVVIVPDTVTAGKYRFSSFKLANEANSAFRTFEIERLTAHKLFVAIFSCYRSFSWSDVPIGIVSICHGYNGEFWNLRLPEMVTEIME